MSYSKPRKDASVENLLSLCVALREGELSRNELAENADIGSSLISDNIHFGVQLDFLEETEDVVRATNRGITASYAEEGDDDLEEQFIDGIRSYTLYKKVFSELVPDGKENGVLTKNDIVRVFRTSVGLTGSESTLGGAAITFLQTLDAAGCGDYVAGRRGNESRIKLSDQFDSIAERVTESDDTNKKESSPATDRIEQETPRENGDPLASPQLIPDRESLSETFPTPFDVSLSLNGDEDPENVEQLILAVRRGFERDLDDDYAERPMDSDEASPDENEGDDLDDESESPDQSLDSFKQTSNESPEGKEQSD
jgi:hypothetical protein